MTLLVPFDGSDLSVAALERAKEFGDALGHEVVVLAVVPLEAEYAAEQGWVDEESEWEPEMFALELRDAAADIAPEATFRTEQSSDPEDEPYASARLNVVRTIRQVAGEINADIVFVGSENAASVSHPLSSVGAPVSSDPRYDVHIVRHVD